MKIRIVQCLANDSDGVLFESEGEYILVPVSGFQEFMQQNLQKYFPVGKLHAYEDDGGWWDKVRQYGKKATLQ